MENRVRTDRQAPDLLRSALSEFRGARLHATGCVGFLGFPLRLLPIDTRAFALSHRTGFARARLGSRLAVRRWFHPAAPRHKIFHRSRPYFHPTLRASAPFIQRGLSSSKTPTRSLGASRLGSGTGKDPRKF